MRIENHVQSHSETTPKVANQGSLSVLETRSRTKIVDFVRKHLEKKDPQQVQLKRRQHIAGSLAVALSVSVLPYHDKKSDMELPKPSLVSSVTVDRVTPSKNILQKEHAVIFKQNHEKKKEPIQKTPVQNRSVIIDLSLFPTQTATKQVKKEMVHETVLRVPVKKEAKIEPVSLNRIQRLGSASKDRITNAIRFQMQELGYTPQGAAMITGNYLQESNLNPNETGDHGKAKGIAQWHPDRRHGMPSGLYEQMRFADREMKRDGGKHNLSTVLKDPHASIAKISNAIRQWERYGIKGKRDSYGKTILQWLQSAK